MGPKLSSRWKANLDAGQLHEIATVPIGDYRVARDTRQQGFAQAAKASDSLLRRLAEEGAAILLYSTDYEELIGCCDRVAVFYDGRIVRMLEGAEITEHALVASALNLPPGATADLYVDERFNVVERSELTAVGRDGTPLPRVPSTLGVPMPLRGPVPPAELLDHATPVVYLLDPTDLGAELLAGLTRGEIYATRFAYRDGHEDQAMFLVKNEHGVFALVGQPTGFDLLRRDSPLAPETAEHDDDGDLDFGMM
jgi:hypothetical protein